MKNKIWIVLFVLFSITNNVYSQCISGNCKNGKGVYIDKKYKDKYTGEFKNGKKHGKGVLISEDGKFKLEGLFVDGNFSKGTITDPDSGYIGEFSNGKYNGFGTLVSDDGSKYIGQFKNGDYHGTGKLLYEDGNKYVGEFKKGNRHGKGKMIAKDGTETSGTYYNNFLEDNIKTKDSRCSGDCENGQGTYTWDNGDKYIGQWRDGKRHGKGKYIFKNKGLLYGMFENDKFIKHIGRPIHSKENHKIIIGYLGDVNFNGEGNLKLENGNSYTGSFINGEFHGKGSMIYRKKGSVYTGNWKNGLRHGHGYIITEKGDRYYKGNWKNDKKDGYGVCTDKISGDFFHYKGNWKNDKMNGKGSLRSIDSGQKFIGTFKNNLLHGYIKVYYNGELISSGQYRNGYAVED